MNPYEKMKEIRQMLTALGFDDKAKVIAVELDEVRARVILEDSGLGIYDFIKHTFVD